MLKGNVTIISGPSGVGKDTILRELRKINKNYHFAISATTRAKRHNERDGVDYYFLPKKQFKYLRSNDKLLEHAVVHGNLYGTLKSQVLDVRNEGTDVIIRIDVQGMRSIKKLIPDAITIFIKPPTMSDLRNRMIERGTESEQDIIKKLRIAYDEIDQSKYYDHVFVNRNNQLDEVVQKIKCCSSRVCVMNYNKYPSTPYWPWSPSMAPNDKIITDPSVFVGPEVVITEKLDGSNYVVSRWRSIWSFCICSYY